MLDKQNFQILKSAVFCQLQLVLSGFFSLDFSNLILGAIDFQLLIISVQFPRYVFDIS